MIAKREPSRATPFTTASARMASTKRPSGAEAASVDSASIARFTVQGMPSAANVAVSSETMPRR